MSLIDATHIMYVFIKKYKTSYYFWHISMAKHNPNPHATLYFCVHPAPPCTYGLHAGTLSIHVARCLS